MKIKLGDEVREKVSGFTGVATARTLWLHGSDTIRIQPHVDSDGDLPESFAFEESSVEKFIKQKVSPGYLKE